MRAFAILLLAACTPSAHEAAEARDKAPAPPDTSPAVAIDTTSESNALDVVELSASSALEQMAAGRLTSHALVQAYLDRIAAIDRAGPTLRSVIELNANALADADALDAERRAGRLRGPLHGLPVLIKDNIDVVGMVNSGGSLALADNRPATDAFAVARLRAAGAVLLGKTNLSEWANIRSTRSTSGWSSRGGQTKNPYVLDRSPCGSSSGTGAALAASLTALGVGTETDGSIVCPASFMGLVGLKPTVGLVSRVGIIPIAISQDTAGPMARSVRDAALLMNALAAVDEHDPAGAAARDHIAADYTALLATNALAGKRIGVLRQAMGYHPDVDAITERALTTLRAQGAEVIDVTMPGWGAWDGPELDVLLAEFKAGIDAYLAHATTPAHSLAELIAWNSAHADQVMPFFGQEMFIAAQAKPAPDDASIATAREAAQRAAGPEGLVATLDGQHLDALIAPTYAPAWPIDPLLGDHYIGSSSSLAAVAGTPALTVPAGDVHGLPVGVTFMGRAYAEAELLALGYAFEQATHARTAPRFLPTL